MDNKITVYYDGLCKGCTFAADTLKKDDSVALVDARSGALPAGITHREAMHDVHVVDEGGNVYKGADAIIKLLERNPRTRFLGRVARAPGMHVLAVGLYRFISHYRYSLFGRKD
jgi:predicted DCC family thiol-disulfide oxidoreductase YuxK